MTLPVVIAMFSALALHCFFVVSTPAVFQRMLDHEIQRGHSEQAARIRAGWQRLSFLVLALLLGCAAFVVASLS